MPDKYVIVLGSRLYCRPFRHIAKVMTSQEVLFKDPKKVCFVVFSGGEDVHPSLYGGLDCGLSYTNLSRDSYEYAIFNQCRRHNIKMIGICRGFQFLNVASGGQMYQHIEGHAIAGRHPAWFADEARQIAVSSTHHQLAKLPSGAIPLVWAMPRRSKIYYGPDGAPTSYVNKEVEGAFFPRTNAMGVQYHPEMMLEAEDGYQKFLHLLSDFLTLSRDTMRQKYIGGLGNDIGRVERALEA